ncbi:major capsid protein [Kitasatospora sp. NPDC049285]|uniref:major capsid protein n=1 Tax=Kitasatospora sp. NPDC049285 TaxID=3157096 RepID=UPI00342A07FE
MTIQDLVKDITVNDLTTFARSIQTPDDYFLTRSVLAETHVNEVMWRIKSTSRRRNAAKYRSFSASVPFATRKVAQTVTQGLFPPLGEKLLVDEQELILQEQARGADQERLIETMYDDVEQHVGAIKDRLELAAGDLLVDGKLTLAENGLVTEADFQVPAANLPVAAKVWSDPTSDPLADELRWIELLRSTGRPLPEIALTSYKAQTYLAGNAAYRAAYYGSVVGSSTPTATLTPTEVASVRARYNLPQIVTYDVQIDVDDVATRVLPENRWILLPPNRDRFGQTQYGTTAQALALSRGSNPQIVREDAPGIVVTRGAQDDPVQIWTAGHAAAMPVLYTADAYVCATVL